MLDLRVDPDLTLGAAWRNLMTTLDWGYLLNMLVSVCEADS